MNTFYLYKHKYIQTTNTKKLMLQLPEMNNYTDK